MANLKRDGLVVETQNLPAALLLVAIDKTDDIADGNRLPAQPLLGLLTDFDIRAVQVDRGVGDQPTLPGF